MRTLETITLAIVLTVGLILGWVAGSFYADLVTAPAARAEGARVERAVWEKAQRDAEAKREAERVAAQARIDEIERGYHHREAARLAELSALEAAIEQEVTRVPIPLAAGPGSSCPAAVPRGLRDALERVGRAAPRHDPAGAHPAVR